VQEVQMATLPVVMALVVGYLAGFIVVLPDPGSTASTVLSVVPFLAPVLMPERIGTGDALAWQVVLAVALTLGTIGAATWLAARIYGNSVLKIGARVRLGEAWQGR
jgi:ABC-2 type transport system permease protein